jgi:hypothetical protein
MADTGSQLVSVTIDTTAGGAIASPARRGQQNVVALLRGGQGMGIATKIEWRDHTFNP